MPLIRAILTGLVLLQTYITCLLVVNKSDARECGENPLQKIDSVAIKTGRSAEAVLQILEEIDPLAYYSITEKLRMYAACLGRSSTSFFRRRRRSVNISEEPIHSVALSQDIQQHHLQVASDIGSTRPSKHPRVSDVSLNTGSTGASKHPRIDKIPDFESSRSVKRPRVSEAARNKSQGHQQTFNEQISSRRYSTTTLTDAQVTPVQRRPTLNQNSIKKLAVRKRDYATLRPPRLFGYGYISINNKPVLRSATSRATMPPKSHIIHQRSSIATSVRRKDATALTNINQKEAFEEI